MSKNIINQQKRILEYLKKKSVINAVEKGMNAPKKFLKKDCDNNLNKAFRLGINAGSEAKALCEIKPSVKKVYSVGTCMNPQIAHKKKNRLKKDKRVNFSGFEMKKKSNTCNSGKKGTLNWALDVVRQK